MAKLGLWDAQTNSPALPSASSVTAGDYYVVSMAGCTVVNSVSNWAVGDMAVSDGTNWLQVPGGSTVSNVAGVTNSVPAPTPTAAQIGSAMAGATAKTSMVDADTMPLNDSAASNVLKKITWANVKATLKTYFDTLYAADVVRIQAACSDQSTALSAGTAKITFRAPCAMTVSEVRASLSTAQSSGNIFTVDINEGGTSILSTKITIDNAEKTSVTAATPPVISDNAIADDAEITVDIDQIGDGTAKGLIVTIIGVKA